MISDEQISRVKAEMCAAASAAFQKARQAELDLEDYSYPRSEHESRQYDPSKREQLLQAYREADYLAESRAWIHNLIRESQIVRGVPDSALCFFKDGDKWCCVNGDFVNLQESPAGFGETFDGALEMLQKKLAVILTA